MIKTLFCSDLHSSLDKYEHLFANILKLKPQAVFLAGDLMGFALHAGEDKGMEFNNFIYDYFAARLEKLRSHLNKQYPSIFLIPGNDDSRLQEAALLDLAADGLFSYVNQRIIRFEDYSVAGYCFIPPSPFLNKDWEKYDVSRYLDPGCISPEEGYRSFPAETTDLRYYTIRKDLEIMFQDADMQTLICLFHAPPYDTYLDRADLDNKFIDYVPLDVHVGSIAIKDFIVNRKPYITLHGHVHESTRLTGHWWQKIGKTYSFQGASESYEHKLILLDLEDPEKAEVIE